MWAGRIYHNSPSYSDLEKPLTEDTLLLCNSMMMRMLRVVHRTVRKPGRGQGHNPAVMSQSQ